MVITYMISHSSNEVVLILEVVENSDHSGVLIFPRYQFQQQPFESVVKRVFLQISHKKAFARVFFSKVACLESATFLKRRLRYKCFPVNFE